MSRLIIPLKVSESSSYREERLPTKRFFSLKICLLAIKSHSLGITPSHSTPDSLYASYFGIVAKASIMHLPALQQHQPLISGQSNLQPFALGQ